MRPLDIVDGICRRLTRIEYSPLALVFAPIAVAAGRTLEEEILFDRRALSIPLLNYTLCYLVLQVAILAAISIATRERFERFVGAVSAGLFLGWLPAVIDVCLAGLGVDQEGRWYLFFQGFEWDFAAPYQLLGETITIWIAIAFVAVYCAWRTRDFSSAVTGFALAWAAFQIVGFALPAAPTMLMGGRPSPRLIVAINWAYLVPALAIYAALNARTLGPSLARVSHALPWGLVTAVGARLAGQPWGAAAQKGVVMLLAAQLLVVANDYFDREMDGLAGGSARPVSRGDLSFALYAMALLIAQAHAEDPGSAYLPVAFLALWNAYHAPGLRLKRLPGLSYLFEGLGAAMCFLYGVRYHGTGFPDGWDDVAYAALAFCGFAVGSIIKDYKDVDQDRAAGIRTAFTWALDRGAALGSAGIAAAALLGAALAVPAILLAVEAGFGAQVAILAALAAIPVVLVRFVRDARRAVGLSFWTVSAYLAVLAIAVPDLLRAG